MKKIFTFLLILFSFTSLGQNSSSVLSNGTWHKFSIDTTGVFKIDSNLLRQIGINPNNINPKNIKIYGNGGAMLPNLNSDFRYNNLQENAIFVSGEDDNTFNSEDYILFYGKGPHDWIIDSANNTASHRQNIYSDKSYYFITVNNGLGKRISPSTEITTNTTTQISVFDDFVFHEKELINIRAIGQDWFGEDFSVESSQTFSIPFRNFVSNSNTLIRVRAAAVSNNTSNMDITVNGGNMFSINFPQVSPTSLTQGFAIEKNTVFTNPKDIIDLEITYNNNGNPSAISYLDYIEIIGKKRLTANNNQFSFRSFEQEDATNIVEFQVENRSSIFKLWNVTDFINPKEILNQSTGTTFSFKANGGILNEYVVLNENDYYTPQAVENSLVENQDLHNLSDINYVVITTPQFVEQANRLANYHSENSNLTTKVVLLHEVYNEFASGSPDITGIRDFLKHLYNTNSSPENKLQFVCFFGDASYDYKDRIPNNTNIVPVYLAGRTQPGSSFNLAESFVTDDYYGMFDPNEGNMNSFDSIEIATSRIPVYTTQQASNVVDKILSYYSKDKFGDWRNTITLMADDIDQRGEDTIERGMEEVADSIKVNRPDLNVSKIYADAFVQENSSGGERYPDVNTALLNAFEKGTLVFDYFGHGGEDGLASERLLTIAEIETLNNNFLPLLVTVTCDFTRFDNPLRLTAGERIFWKKNGGVANLITTTREVFISVGQRFNKTVAKYLLAFNEEDYTISQALVEAKNNTTSKQKFFIYNIGDPAMKLAVAKPNIRITKMNGLDIIQSLDTLKALSKVKFEGIVTDTNNNILNDFNGTLSATVFDKPVIKETLDNDNFGIIMPFDSQESKLFRGKSTVENGNFQFEFIVPRDIRIAYGKGKLSFYADNKQIDKTGANFDIIVGGIDPNAPEDNIGPEIQLFMNDESFIDGSNTNSSPNFIAKLADPSGINTSITAVDHDIVAILDGDQSNPFILNDFYETELNDFTKGTATYRLRNLSVGPHTISLKAWDTYNNSSEATLNFVVVSDAGLTLDNVLNYPNPFVNYTEFWFNHNKPNEPLNVQVQIFTVTGKLVKTINQNVQTNGALSRSISWNGLDDFGNKIGKGVYVYKLKVTSTLSNLVSEKYEKLVILQ